MHDASDIATFVVCCSVSLATLLGLARILWFHRPFAHMRFLLASSLKAVHALHKVEQDEVGLMVAKKLRQQKVADFCWACQALCLCSCPLTAYLMFNMCTGRPRVNTAAQDCAQLLIHAVSAVALVRPKVISWRNLDLFYSAIAISMAVFISPWACRSDTLTSAIMAVNFTMAILNIVRRAALIVIVENFVLAGVASSTIMLSDLELSNPVSIVIIQVAFLAVLPACAYVLEVSTRASQRQEVEMRATKDMLSATSALLRSCYDVVVELDSEGVIVGLAQALASFLLRGSRRCLQGSEFAKLISHDDDRERFLEKLGVPPPSEGLAEAVHVRMRDGDGNTLRVELLWFAFRHVDGERHYMIGLREFSDITPNGVGEEPQQPWPLVRGQEQRQPQAAGRGENNDGGHPSVREAGEEQQLPPARRAPRRIFTASSNDKERSSISQASAHSGGAFDDVRPMLFLDGSRPGLPVLSYSTGFGARIARLPQGSHFQDHVKHWGEFKEWLQTGVATINEGRDAPACNVSLKVSQGRVMATCCFSSGGPPGRPYDSAELIDPRRMCLAFWNIQRCNRGDDGPIGGVCSPRESKLRGTPVGRMAL